MPHPMPPPPFTSKTFARFYTKEEFTRIIHNTNTDCPDAKFLGKWVDVGTRQIFHVKEATYLLESIKVSRSLVWLVLFSICASTSVSLCFTQLTVMVFAGKVLNILTKSSEEAILDLGMTGEKSPLEHMYETSIYRFQNLHLYHLLICEWNVLKVLRLLYTASPPKKSSLSTYIKYKGATICKMSIST